MKGAGYRLGEDETGPFAILVDDTVGERPQDIPVVTRSEAIRYRQDNRLAVIPATSVDIASFDGTFREVVGPGFPLANRPPFGLSDLARVAAGMLSEVYGNVQGFDEPHAAVLLRYCMDEVAELLAEEREGAASWTREWFELVDRALYTLVTLPDYYAKKDSAISYQEMLESSVWSAFGLPRPTETQRRENTAQLIQTLNERWASEDAISLTTRELAISGRHGAAELARCADAGWDGLDEAIVREGGVLSGLQSFLTGSPERVAAFSHVDRDIFFGQDDRDSSPVVRTADGNDASLATEVRVQVPVLSSSLEGTRIVSERFILDVPAIQTPPGVVVAGSRLTVEAESPRTANVEQKNPPGLAGANVRLELTVSMPVRKTLKLQKVRLRVRVPANDPLHGYLRQRAIDIFVVPPVGAAAILAPWTDKKRSRLSVPLYEGPEEVAEEYSGDGAMYMVELKPSRDYRVAFYAPGGEPRGSTLQLQPSDRHGWWFGDIPADIPAVIVDRGATWEFEAAAQSTAPQSLLVSAALGVSVDASDPKSETLLSLRGQLETLLANNVANQSFLEGLGHVALPTDEAVHVEALKLSDHSLVRQTHILVPSQLENKWGAAAPVATAPTDWHSARDEFVVAWQDCLAALEPALAESPGRSLDWPSKRSTLWLGKRRSLVPAMLGAYTRMVQRSQAADPLIRFVSTFPFSASGWKIQPSSVDCEAVLLSPWHPLRLAWLASVEETLSASQRAHALVGTLEGWKFPFVAPSPLTHGRMIAVPTDGGQDDIFTAWNLMLPLAFGDMKPVRAPSHIAGLAMPGSSASGLTGSAADAAVRDFRRVNGHLSSVTIDLASSSPSQRMVELDESVLSAARLWSTGASPVTGLDIRDSLNRHGDLPRQEVTDLLRDGLATSISWSRYRPQAGQPVRSNLRLLQDSGVKLSQDVDSGDRRGILGNVPLRRFEGPAEVDASKAVLQPSVNGSTPFAEALRAVEERSARAPRVLVGLHLSQLLDDHADWSISGDSFVSASILATTLARHAEAGQPRRMLWEWRPPFLDPNKGSALNRRPYASVMRIGNQLTARISEHINRVDSQSTIKANDVFATLGAQGIGLSSLLTMGGHHASGALGFYLTLRMIELAKPSEPCLQAVMPIDSCRSFLDALAPDSKSSETRRQADLLVIRATPQSVCFIPVEIKMYGLDGSSHESLPSPGSRFDEALDQLKSTTTLLARLQDERRQLEEEERTHDKALWDNALATLLEAALRLNPSTNDDVDLVTETLESIVNGMYDLASMFHEAGSGRCRGWELRLVG